MLVIVLIAIITVVLLIGMDRVGGQHATDGRHREAVDDRGGFTSTADKTLGRLLAFCLSLGMAVLSSSVFNCRIDLATDEECQSPLCKTRASKLLRHPMIHRFCYSY